MKGGTGVLLSNYMSNWYGGEFQNDGGNVDLNGNRYKMSSGAYGYIYTKDLPDIYVEKPNYDNLIHTSNGAKIDITYFSDENESIKVTTSGYFLMAGGTGGPLPGVFFAGLLSMDTVFGASKMKKKHA